MERGLYVVPTPIGNLGDMTHRGLDVLRGVSVIAAEDTRHCRQLLNHFALSTPVVAYHEHSGRDAAIALCERMAQGDAVALVSDAGTPLVSDPGYVLVRETQERGLPVVPLPGPCAAITALSASGLPTDRFRFEGFLPARAGPRETRLESLRSAGSTLIFYEAPHRIVDSLRSMVSVFGSDREAALGRELTKRFETIRRAPLGRLWEWVSTDPNQQRGEMVVMLAGAGSAPAAQVDASILLQRLAQELPPRRAAALVAELTGEKARDLYQQLLDAR